MKCSVCNGRGFFPISNIAAKVCPQCNGTGEVEQTNEEWFCNLSTEEKAKWLSNRDEFIYDCGKRSLTPKIMDKDEWDEWLKQPHTNEVEK